MAALLTDLFFTVQGSMAQGFCKDPRVRSVNLPGVEKYLFLPEKAVEEKRKSHK
jgi:hypothetical protein